MQILNFSWRLSNEFKPVWSGIKIVWFKEIDGDWDFVRILFVWRIKSFELKKFEVNCIQAICVQ